MTVKHSPATNLPWSVTGFSSSRIQGLHEKSGKQRNVADFVEYVGGKGEDAAYAVHAANAYPKLVAALKGQYEGTFEQLLRELGEAE